ncbi:MAG: A24 family peptidase [Clostridiales bacterium]
MYFSLIIIFLILIVINDYKTYKIKNIIIVPFLISGYLFNIYFLGFSGFIDSLAGSLIPFLVLFFFFSINTLGAGDIKALCTLGSITGIDGSTSITLYTFIAGGLISIFIILMKNLTKERFLYFINYIKMLFLTRRFEVYDNFIGLDKSKTRFSGFIFIGSIIYLVKIYC